MVVDLRWRDAMAAPVIACEFNARGDGWPVAMTAIQLAAMQRPYVRGDAAARNLVRALRGHIEAGCKDGSIAHTEKVERVLSQAAVIQNRQPAPDGWPTWYERDGYDSGRSRPAIYKDVTRFYIDAPAFAAWLHATHLEPSPHIAAWFEVRGVAWPPVAVVAAIAPTDWASFVAAFKARRRRAPWSDDEKNLLQTEFTRRKGWQRDKATGWARNAAIQTAIAAELGLSRQSLDRHLGDAGPNRAAAVFGGMGATLGGRG